ncbi:hypothetical protein RBG61_01420 [Paludicola sp. MB14-C6]|nr:hypothetical protein [Paludicola sp. MB14-C6]WMJ23349.1 hypothetical protein RBG61_01420 [Paludicola sp. MB14-C6]
MKSYYLLGKDFYKPMRVCPHCKFNVMARRDEKRCPKCKKKFY